MVTITATVEASEEVESEDQNGDVGRLAQSSPPLASPGWNSPTGYGCSRRYQILVKDYLDHAEELIYLSPGFLREATQLKQ